MCKCERQSKATSPRCEPRRYSTSASSSPNNLSNYRPVKFISSISSSSSNRGTRNSCSTFSRPLCHSISSSSSSRGKMELLRTTKAV